MRRSDLGEKHTTLHAVELLFVPFFISTRLRHLPDLLNFIWKYIFLNNSGALKDFRIFFLETLGKMFEVSVVK